MSPAWRIILFVASPLSISSFKLIVIVLFKRGGSPGAGEFAEAVGTTDAEDPDSCAGPGRGVTVETAAGAGASGPIALVNHRMSDSPDDGNGLALPLFNAETYLGMRDQAVGFQDFGDLLFGLDFRQSSDMQANRHEWDADGTSLADAHFPGELFYIENFDVQHVAIPDDVVMRHRPRRRGHRTYAVVNLLWRLENGLLSAAGRRQIQ